MDEKQHAFIVSEYYRLLKEKWGEQGVAVFRLAAITYGEQRGKRMAMRCLKDGHALDYEGYFAYGEYPSTPAYFDVEMWDEEGTVHEQVTRCPWAGVFASRGMKDCGVVYCREIDRAIVRGFNPELEIETASTQHLEGCCRFFFRDKAVRPGLLEKAEQMTASRRDITRPLDFHCAHVLHTFAETVHGVWGEEGDAVTDRVKAAFRETNGDEMADALLALLSGDFESIA